MFAFVDGRLRRVVLLLILLLLTITCLQYETRVRRIRLQVDARTGLCAAHDPVPGGARVGTAALASAKTISLDSAHWYRVGKPFHDSSITSIALAFNVDKNITEPAPPTEESLIFYAQSLSGVFTSDRVQYVAATRSKYGVFIHTKTSGSSVPQRTAVAGCTTDCGWQTLSVVMTSSGPAARLLSFGKHAPPPAALQAALAKMKTASKPQAFQLDSGIYIAGVVDRQSVSMAGDYPAGLKALSGEMVSKLVINGMVVPLNSDETNRGVILEKTKEFMARFVHCDLHRPVHSIANKHRDMSDPTMVHFPVVTAVSDNHLLESEGMILSIATVMKERGVLVYDLGLNSANIQKLNSFRNVSVRNVRWDLFDDLLRNLKEYRWKPIIIHGALQEFGAVLYSDASIRYHQSITNIGLLRNGPGFVGFGPKGTSPTGAFTHSSTLQYLGVQRAAVVNATISTGGIQIWVDDQGAVRDVIMSQWLGCALSSECMAPIGSSPYGCRFELLSQGKFIGCHRFDQSALSVVLWKVFHDITANSYQLNHPEDLKFATIERRNSKLDLWWLRCIVGLLAIFAVTFAICKATSAQQPAVK